VLGEMIFSPGDVSQCQHQATGRLAGTRSRRLGMKRDLLVVAASSSMLALAAPPPALAQGGHHNHGARHASTHKRGHRAHVLRCGGSRSGSPGTAPTTGSPSSGEPAGTVVSFTEGVLTIKLTGKSGAGKMTEVSGKVTERSELQCEPAMGAGQGSNEQR